MPSGPTSSRSSAPPTRASSPPPPGSSGREPRPRTWPKRCSWPSGEPRCRPARPSAGCPSPPPTPLSTICPARAAPPSPARGPPPRALGEGAVADVSAAAPDAADTVVTLDERRRVREALARLPRTQAVALVLRHSGVSYAEGAAALHLSPGSVGTTVRRAESALREELNRDASPD